MIDNFPANGADNPFFLVGPVRAGTTLLRLMLGHHPNICHCNEMEYVAPFIGVDGHIEKDLVQYFEFLESHKGFRASGYVYDQDADFPNVVKNFLVQRQRKDQKPLVGATVHHDYERLPFIWPQSKYIFLNRDPRDVARSCVQMGWNGTAWGASSIWNKAFDSWQELGNTISAEQKLELRFEDLVSRPEQVLVRICDFLAISYDPSMMNIEGDTTYSRPSSKEARSWRDSASENEIAQVESRIGDRLIRSGYDPSGVRKLADSPINRIRIQIEDVLKRIVFRWKRYGFVLWFSHVIVKRLPFKGIRKKVALRIQEIDILHHK